MSRFALRNIIFYTGFVGMLCVAFSFSWRLGLTILSAFLMFVAIVDQIANKDSKP